MVASDQAQRVCALLLHPGESSLTRCRQVVTVGEVEAILKVLLDVIHHLSGLLLDSQLEWDHCHFGYLENFGIVQGAHMLGAFNHAEVVDPKHIHYSHDAIDGS